MLVDGQRARSLSNDAPRSPTISERQQLAAERWLGYRRGTAEGRGPSPLPERERRRDFGAEPDL